MLRHRSTLLPLGYGLSLAILLVGVNSLRWAMGVGLNGYYCAAAGGLIGLARGSDTNGPFIFERYRGHPGILNPTLVYWDGVDIAVAFYIPLLLVLIPTVLLHRQRAIPAHHCRCGYDLTGNTSGICPECGTHRSENPSPGTD